MFARSLVMVVTRSTSPSAAVELHDKGRRLTLKAGRILGPDGWIRP